MRWSCKLYFRSDLEGFVCYIKSYQHEFQGKSKHILSRSIAWSYTFLEIQFKIPKRWINKLRPTSKSNMWKWQKRESQVKPNQNARFKKNI